MMAAFSRFCFVIGMMKFKNTTQRFGRFDRVLGVKVTVKDIEILIYHRSPKSPSL